MSTGIHTDTARLMAEILTNKIAEIIPQISFSQKSDIYLLLCEALINGVTE